MTQLLVKYHNHCIAVETMDRKSVIMSEPRPSTIEEREGVLELLDTSIYR